MLRNEFVFQAEKSDIPLNVFIIPTQCTQKRHLISLENYDFYLRNYIVRNNNK